MTKQKWTEGALLEVPVNETSVSYALMLRSPEMAFFHPIRLPDVRTTEEIAGGSIAFRVWVMRTAYGSGRWRKVGKVALPEDLRRQVPRFKQDKLSGRICLYLDGQEGEELTVEECANLECAAVWSAEHVEDRLCDLQAGRENKWVQSMKPKAV